MVFQSLRSLKIRCNLHAQLLQSGIGGIKGSPLFQRINTLIANVPRRVKIRLAHSERDHIVHLRNNIEKLPDPGRLQRCCLVCNQICSHGVTISRISSSFLSIMVPWSLYFFRMKCVVVPRTVSSVESLLVTKPDTSFKVFPSRMTIRS